MDCLYPGPGRQADCRQEPVGGTQSLRAAMPKCRPAWQAGAPTPRATPMHGIDWRLASDSVLICARASPYRRTWAMAVAGIVGCRRFTCDDAVAVKYGRGLPRTQSDRNTRSGDH